MTTARRADLTIRQASEFDEAQATWPRGERPAAIRSAAEEFRASQIMLDRARETENVELLTPYTVTAFLPGEGGALGRAELRNVDTGEQRELTISGAFIAIGHEPQSALVKGQVELDENGYVITQQPSTRTNRPGVFAAGDLVDHTYRQAITAAGSGCAAAIDAERWLGEHATEIWD